MDAIIRSARASDHPQLARLFAELDRLHREQAPWLLREPDCDPRPENWLERRLADARSAIFVADAEQCVGLATVGLRDAPSSPVFIPQRRAVMDNLFVHADWRRRGIGRRLYDACEGWAREHGAPWIEANVYDFNRAAFELYQALGFEAVMRRLRKPLGD